MFKPLLDQFQGCYKDKYRSFTAYYMICQLVIILIIIASPSNNSIAQFILIIASTLLALIVVTLKPYENKTLNCFDGFILQLVTLLLTVPLLSAFDQTLLLSFIFTAIVLPLVIFIVMEVVINKDTVKKVILYCSPKPANTVDDNVGAPVGEIGVIVDDNIRRNAIM